MVEDEEAKKVLADFKIRQTQFEEKVLNNLERYQKKMLEMEPYLNENKDDKERNKEKLALLIQGPKSLSLIEEEYHEEEK